MDIYSFTYIFAPIKTRSKVQQFLNVRPLNNPYVCMHLCVCVQSNLALGRIVAFNHLFHLHYTGQGVPNQKPPLPMGERGPCLTLNTVLLGITRVSLPSGISFHLTALAWCTSVTDTNRWTTRGCSSMICHNRPHYHFQRRCLIKFLA